MFIQTNLIAYPLKLVRLIYGKNLIRNGLYEQAIHVLNEIDNMHVHVAETMY